MTDFHSRGRATGPAHAYAELVHLVASAADHVAVEAHQEPDLVGRARPVLGGEGVGRDRLDADLDGALDDVEERGLTLLVPLRPGQSALLGPAAVAVHDDRDVPGHQVARHRRRGRATGVRVGPTDASLHGQTLASERAQRSTYAIERSPRSRCQAR